MRNIVSEIHWDSGYITETHPNLNSTFQWTPSHQDTFGNDCADYLANDGRQSLPDHSVPEQDLWCYLSLRAACNRNKIPIHDSLESDLRQSVKQSRFGRTYRYIEVYCSPQQISWTSRYRKSLRGLSRQDVRILIALRTGHDYLNYYRYSRLRTASTPLCPCGVGSQTIQHILRTCTNPAIQRLRSQVMHTARTLKHQWLRSLSPDELAKYHNNPHTSRYSRVYTYTDPPSAYPQHVQRSYQRLIISLYKVALSIACPKTKHDRHTH